MVGLRRTCSRCRKRRRVNVYWSDTGAVLCRPCSREDGVAFAYSVRSFSYGLTFAHEAMPGAPLLAGGG